VRQGLALLAVCALAIAAWPGAAFAEPIPNQIAVFMGLDKITAKIYPLEIAINETKIFGALQVTPRACFTRPPTEPPQTTAFVEVEELRHKGEPKRILTGWMFASSPALNAVEHPVYDVWLINCKTTSGEASGSSE